MFRLACVQGHQFHRGQVGTAAGLPGRFITVLQSQKSDRAVNSRAWRMSVKEEADVAKHGSN